MNTAILVTKHNAADMIETARRIGASQSRPVNGALVILHTSTTKDAVQPIADALGSKFPAVHSLATVQSERTQEIALGVLMARFMIGCYTRFPGPWMIIDSYCAPLVDDVIEVSLRQHRAAGSPVSGRADVQTARVVPIGPLVLSSQAKALKFLRFASGESWRDRLGVVLARGGFSLIPVEQWPFTLAKETQVERKVELVDTPDSFNPEAATDEELRAELHKRTGTKPHHFTKREKLLDLFSATVA